MFFSTDMSLSIDFRLPPPPPPLHFKLTRLLFFAFLLFIFCCNLQPSSQLLPWWRAFQNHTTCINCSKVERKRDYIILLLYFTNIYYTLKKTESFWERFDFQPVNCAVWLSKGQATSSFYYFNIVSC